jgi:predicted ester cyclase
MTQADADFGSRWFEQVWNRKRREAIGEMMAPGAAIHEGGETVYGPEGFYPFFDRMLAAFSELHVTVQDTIIEGDKMCVRWSCTMKHTGGGLGMAPTGRVLETTGISILTIAGGKAVECWQNWDMLGLMQQIQQAAKAPTYVASTA